MIILCSYKLFIDVQHPWKKEKIQQIRAAEIVKQLAWPRHFKRRKDWNRWSCGHVLTHEFSQMSCPIDGCVVREKLLYYPIWFQFVCCTWKEKACYWCPGSDFLSQNSMLHTSELVISDKLQNEETTCRSSITVEVRKQFLAHFPSWFQH